MDAEVFAREAFAHQVDDGLDGDAARDFAGVVAAHAVGKHQKPDVHIGCDGVFVVFADTSGIGLPDERELAFEAHRHSPPSLPLFSDCFDHTCAQCSKRDLTAAMRPHASPRNAMTYQQCEANRGNKSHFPGSAPTIQRPGINDLWQ